MTYRNSAWTGIIAGLAALALSAGDAAALESDREQPLEVYADDTDGSLGDGTTVLSGRVEIRQGTLHIQANQAEVEKSDGKVRTIRFRGAPATLHEARLAAEPAPIEAAHRAGRSGALLQYRR